MRHTLACFTRLTAVAVILCGLAAALLGDSAMAQGFAFGIRPAGADGVGSYFAYTLAPGESATGEAIVSSAGLTSLELRLYAADGVTASGGGTAFAEAGQSHSGASGWVSLPVEAVSVPAGVQVSVSFTVSVPPDARPGDHIAGIVAEAPPRAGAAGGIQTSVVERVGVAVVVHVPGALTREVVLGDFCLNQASGSNYFELAASNTGNVIARGSGTFRLETSEGQHVFERPVELGAILPGDQTPIRIHAPQDPPPGEYRALIELEQEDGTVAEAESAVTVPVERTDGCALVSEQAGARSEDGSERDNFNIPGLAAAGSGSTPPWLLLTLVGAVIALAAALAWALRRGRTAREDRSAR